VNFAINDCCNKRVFTVEGRKREKEKESEREEEGQGKREIAAKKYNTFIFLNIF